MKKVKMIALLLAAAVLAAGMIKIANVTRAGFQSGDIAALLPYLLLGIVSVIVLIIAVIIFILYASKSRGPDAGESEGSTSSASDHEEPSAPTAGTRFSKIALAASFSTALRKLRQHASIKDYLYQIPWFLMVGPAAGGKTTVLRDSGLNQPLGPAAQGSPDLKNACDWWFFENAAVLDVAGDLVLGTDGASADHGGWKLLLRLMQKYRPKRPVDGVILTVPCQDLMAPANRQDGDLNWIAERAAYLYQKIWQAQNTLGMRFPIYVLITQCDRIKGFDRFCQALPDRYARQIFGWSNPHGIDTAYSEQWPDQVMNSINEKVLGMQYEIFAAGGRARENDQIFAFHQEIKKTSPGLKVFLNRLFTKSAYHESFVLRGVYFCGRNEASSAVRGRSGTYFIQDLLAGKVFCEHKLAQPLKRTLVSRNRRVRLAQMAVAMMLTIGGLGLWNAYERLKEDKEALAPVLQEIGKDLSRLGRSDEDSEGLKLYTLMQKRSASFEFEKAALNLFKGMANIKDLTYLFIPSSWFSNLHADIESTMTHAYDEIILKSMYIRLLQKAKAAFEADPGGPGQTERKAGTQAVEESWEYLRLKRFLEDLKVLEENANLYNGLKNSRNMEDLGRVVKYLYDVNLPQEFYHDAQYYHEALHKTEYRSFDPSIFRIKAKHFTLKKLVGGTYDRIFGGNLILSNLRQLEEKLEQFKQQGPDGNRNLDLIAQILTVMQATADSLADPQLAWVFNPELDLGQGYSELLTMIEKSMFMGPDLRSEAQQQGVSAFRAMKTQIENRRAAITGLLLQRDEGRITAKLSQGVLDLKTDLEKLLAQNFMTAPVPYAGEATILPGHRIRWLNNHLESAVALFEPFELFEKENVPRFPSDIQANIQRVARQSLQSKLMAMLAKAQASEVTGAQFEDQMQEDEAAAEVRNFKHNANQLLVLFSKCRSHDLIEPYQLLSDTLYWQTASLLTAFDALLGEEVLYSPRAGSLDWWSGIPQLSLQAYDVMDEQELKHYLMLQRRRVQFIAEEYVKPLVDFLLATGLLRDAKEETLLYKWQRIVQELEKYETKKPENSVTQLENFILFDMDKIDPATYRQIITRQQLNERSGDYFLEKRNELLRMIYWRCARLSEESLMSQYARIEGYFNKQLAGRFPFAVPRKNALPALNANPEHLRDFYSLFDPLRDNLPEILGKAKSLEISARQVLDFFARMEAVREVFGNYVGQIDPKDPKSKKDLLPTIPLMVELRVNREHEIQANKIIDWQLTIGDQVFRYGGQRQAGKWQYGDPVSLSLRWASDSTAQPVFAGRSPDISIKGKTITYEFKDEWSLLRLMTLYAATPGDFANGSEDQPNTLAFTIQTEQEGSKSEARIFIRISVQAGDDQGKSIALPVFPTKAPGLSRPAVD